MNISHRLYTHQFGSVLLIYLFHLVTYKAKNSSHICKPFEDLMSRLFIHNSQRDKFRNTGEFFPVVFLSPILVWRPLGFDVVSGAYTTIRRDRCFLVGHVYLAFPSGSFYCNLTVCLICCNTWDSALVCRCSSLFVMFPFQKTPEGQRPKAKGKEKPRKTAGFVRHLCVRLLSPAPECGTLGREINLGGDFVPPLIMSHILNWHSSISSSHI